MVIVSKLVPLKNRDEILIIFSELDLRYLYDRYIHKENIETNPFNLAYINSNYYDVNDILPDKLSHNNCQYKVIRLNIQGLLIIR